MMVDIPIPPSTSKFTMVVTPNTTGKTMLYHGLNSGDVVVAVWQQNPDGTQDLVHVGVKIVSYGQLELAFAPYDPTVPNSVVPHKTSYKVVVMG